MRVALKPAWAVENSRATAPASTPIARQSRTRKALRVDGASRFIIKSVLEITLTARRRGSSCVEGQPTLNQRAWTPVHPERGYWRQARPSRPIRSVAARGPQEPAV
jgi:hypothetical protein